MTNTDKMTLSEWVEEYYNIDYHPIPPELKGVMDAISNPEVEKVTLMFGNQTGKSFLLLCALGYFSHYNSSPIAMMNATNSMAHDFFKYKFKPFAESMPVLKSLINMGDNDCEYDKYYHYNEDGSLKECEKYKVRIKKTFAGGFASFVSANLSNFVKDPHRIVLAEGIDRFVSNHGEGDALKLLEKTTTNFSNTRKIVLAETPVFDNDVPSRISMSYQESSQSRLHVKCPNCGNEHPMIWKSIDLQNKKYKCQSCGNYWSDAQRIDAICKGKWKADNPENKTHMGFHLPRFSSSFCMRLEDIVNEFLKIKGEDDPNLNFFVNTVLAQEHIGAVK